MSKTNVKKWLILLAIAVAIALVFMIVEYNVLSSNMKNGQSDPAVLKPDAAH